MNKLCKTCGQPLVNASPIDWFCDNKDCYTNSQEAKQKRRAEMAELMLKQDIKDARELLIKYGYKVVK